MIRGRTLWLLTTWLLVTVAVPVLAGGDPRGVPVCNVTASLEGTTGLGWRQQGGLLQVYFSDSRDDSGDIRTVFMSAASYFNDILPADGPAVVVRPGTQWDVHAAAVDPGFCLSQFGCVTATLVYVDEDLDHGIVQAIRARRVFRDVNDWDVAVTPPAGECSGPRVASDGGLGAFVGWIDTGSGPEPQGRIQHLGPDGAPLWDAAGLAVCTAAVGMPVVELLADGQGGVYAVWEDLRSPSTRAIYATRFDATGSRPAGWPAGGRLVRDGPVDANTPRIAPDGSGGLYVAWVESSVVGGNVGQPRLARILANGNTAAAWPGDGLPIVDVSPQEVQIDDLQPDGLGGVVVGMAKVTGSFNRALFARVGPDAARPAGWPAAGLLGSTSDVEQHNVRLIGQAGGLIGVWEDYRGGTPAADIYGARFLPGGARATGWDPAGQIIGGGPIAHFDPLIGPDATDGAVVVWSQGSESDPTGIDLFGQTVNGVGELDVLPGHVPPPVLALTLRSRNPSRAGFRFTLDLPSDSRVIADVVDVAGRRVAGLDDRERGAGTFTLSWSGTADNGAPVAAGIYFVRVRTARGTRSLPLVVAR